MVLSSGPKGLCASTSLLSIAARQSVRKQAGSSALRLSMTTQMQTRQQHAVSNPKLANIEKRWEEMPPPEQAELWMALRDRMKVDWNDLTFQEKKASYWIAFGPHGPRALPDPNDKFYLMRVTAIAVAISGVIAYTLHHAARPPPKTMNAEWQEMSNEYLKNQKTEAITGVSSEGYDGPGMVQSAPLGKNPKADEDE